jgi:hypothetical protein
MRSPFVALGVLAFASVAGLAPTAPAHAKLGEGDVAPDFEGRDYFNTSPVSLKLLRGRLVFIELFSTG